jgi:hypothetical protein
MQDRPVQVSGSMLLGGSVLSTIADTWTYLVAAYILLGL